MRHIKLLKPQPSPKNGRDALVNITNCFPSRAKPSKEGYIKSSSLSPNKTTQNILQNIQTQKSFVHKLHTETKFISTSPRCINHRQKQGKFRCENQSKVYFYCQNCAVELSQRGKRIQIGKQESTCPMVGQARQYIRLCQQILSRLNMQLCEIKHEKISAQHSYLKNCEDIETERLNVISSINQKYDKQFKQQGQNWKRKLGQFQEEEKKLKQFQREFYQVKQDVAGSIQDINVHIQMTEFREIMDIYWTKINKFQAQLENMKISSPIADSTKTFIAKYIPPLQKIQRAQQTKPISGRQFTFSKNIKNLQERARQTSSYGDQVTESGESIVEQRVRIN